MCLSHVKLVTMRQVNKCSTPVHSGSIRGNLFLNIYTDKKAEENDRDVIINQPRTFESSSRNKGLECHKKKAQFSPILACYKRALNCR